MNRPRIFISYSSKDRNIVERIHECITSFDNLEVWRDETRLEANWSREIAFALAGSDVLCLMWSQSAAASKWVKHEWLTARALKKERGQIESAGKSRQRVGGESPPHGNG